MILTVAMLQQRRALARHAAQKRNAAALRQRSVAPAAAPASGVGPDSHPPAPGATLSLIDLEWMLLDFMEKP